MQPSEVHPPEVREVLLEHRHEEHLRRRLQRPLPVLPYFGHRVRGAVHLAVHEEGGDGEARAPQPGVAVHCDLTALDPGNVVHHLLCAVCTQIRFVFFEEVYTVRPEGK